MTSRLKRKLNDLGVDTTSSKANENFCLVSMSVALSMYVTNTITERRHPDHRSELLFLHSRSRGTLASSFHYGSRRCVAI